MFCASNYCKVSWKNAKVEYFPLIKVDPAPKTVKNAYLDTFRSAGKAERGCNQEASLISAQSTGCLAKDYT